MRTRIRSEWSTCGKAIVAFHKNIYGQKVLDSAGKAFCIICTSQKNHAVQSLCEPRIGTAWGHHAFRCDLFLGEAVVKRLRGICPCVQKGYFIPVEGLLKNANQIKLDMNLLEARHVFRASRNFTMDEKADLWRHGDVATEAATVWNLRSFLEGAHNAEQPRPRLKELCMGSWRESMNSAAASPTLGQRVQPLGHQAAMRHGNSGLRKAARLGWWELQQKLRDWRNGSEQSATHPIVGNS